MKLLLDENLSRRIVPFILDSYPESSQVALVGLEQSNDLAIWQYAIKNNYVIATKDSDFHGMSILHGQPPKIIWLKIGNQSKTETITVLKNNREAIEQALLIDNNACIEIY